MGIYVPGAYMDAIDHGDGTFSCKISNKNNIDGFTADTSSIDFPINTEEYSA